MFKLNRRHENLWTLFLFPIPQSPLLLSLFPHSFAYAQTHEYLCMCYSCTSLSLSLSLYIYTYIWGGFLILLMYLRYPFLIHFCFWSNIYLYIDRYRKTSIIAPVQCLWRTGRKWNLYIQNWHSPWQVMMKNHNSACF